MIRANHAWLNPGHAYGVVWEPASLSGMIGLPVERVVKEDTQVMLGRPAHPPQDLINRLKASFADLSGVEAVWLALAVWPATQEEAWYLDVRTSSSDHEPIRRALSLIVDGIDMQGRVLDMVINSAGADEGVGIVIVGQRPSVSPLQLSRQKNWLRKLLG